MPTATSPRRPAKRPAAPEAPATAPASRKRPTRAPAAPVPPPELFSPSDGERAAARDHRVRVVRIVPARTTEDGVHVPERTTVAFNGSEAAFAIWQRGHAMFPADQVVRSKRDFFAPAPVASAELTALNAATA